MLVLTMALRMPTRAGGAAVNSLEDGIGKPGSVQIPTKTICVQFVLIP